jgi:hypothetical protein
MLVDLVKTILIVSENSVIYVRDKSGNPFYSRSFSEGNEKIATDSPTRFFSGTRP